MAEWKKDTDEFQMFGEFYTLTKKWYEGFRDLKQSDEFTKDINVFIQKYAKSNKRCAKLSRELAITLDKFVCEVYQEKL